jgi:hypothetical protein
MFGVVVSAALTPSSSRALPSARTRSDEVLPRRRKEELWRKLDHSIARASCSSLAQGTVTRLPLFTAP